MDDIRIKRDEITFRDILGEREGMVKVDLTKVKERIKQCQADKLNERCRRELRDIGVEFVGD